MTAGLGAAGYVRDYVPIGLALTTTALGTLLPILRDNDMLGRCGDLRGGYCCRDQRAAGHRP